MGARRGSKPPLSTKNHNHPSPPPPFKDGQLKWCTWSAHAYRCSGYNCCTCKETYLSVFFKDGIMFYIVGILIRMSFVHAFIILWTQSNMNTRSAGHCVQPIVNPNCEHFGAYHWLLLCYSIFLSFSKEWDFCLSVWALVLFASVLICCRSVTEDVGAAGTTCGWRVPSLPTDHIQGRLQQRYRRFLSN